jgi:aryl-alcohol dehydrogenase-like predicted oxidoreductase
MQRRRLGGLEVSAVGLGCATMTPFYDEPDRDAAIDTVHHAREVGVNFLDSSDAYGHGRNEELIACAAKGHRDEYVIASKFGNLRAPDGSPTSDGRPEYVKACCHRSLKRLETDFNDLYYIHRVDPTVPIEDTVGAMGELVPTARYAISAYAMPARRQSGGPTPRSRSARCRSSIRCGPAMSSPRSCHSARSSASVLSPTARSAAVS